MNQLERDATVVPFILECRERGEGMGYAHITLKLNTDREVGPTGSTWLCTEIREFCNRNGL